jgi:hypothetical protein
MSIEPPSQEGKLSLMNPLGAWRVVINPDRYEKYKRGQVIEFGVNQFTDSSDFFRTADKYAVDMLQTMPDKSDIFNSPRVLPDNPCKLVIISSAASIALKNSSMFNCERYLIRAHKHVHEAFAWHVLYALNKLDHNNMLYLYAAEAAFNHGIKRLITGNHAPGPAQAYFEASDGAPAKNKYDSEENRVTQDGAVYIPFDEFNSAFINHLICGGRINSVIDNWINKYTALERIRSGYERRALLNNTPNVDDEVERFQSLNHTHRLYYREKYRQELQYLLKAVYTAPAEIANLNDILKIKDIKAAIDWYCEQPASKKHQRQVEREYQDIITKEEQEALESKFRRASDIKSYLEGFDNNTDEPQPDSQKVAISDENPPRYNLQYIKDGIRRTNVTEIKNVFTMPCLLRIHDRFKSSSPKNINELHLLYRLVKYIISCGIDVTTKDIDSFFRHHYDWYDGTALERILYGLDYERRQDTAPTPILCEQFSRKSVCIGRKNCQYSLGKSPKLDNRVYKELE